MEGYKRVSSKSAKEAMMEQTVARLPILSVGLPLPLGAISESKANTSYHPYRRP